MWGKTLSAKTSSEVEVKISEHAVRVFPTARFAVSPSHKCGCMPLLKRKFLGETGADTTCQFVVSVAQFTC